MGENGKQPIFFAKVPDEFKDLPLVCTGCHNDRASIVVRRGNWQDILYRCGKCFTKMCDRHNAVKVEFSRFYQGY